MGSQGKVKKLMKGLAGQAKELSSQWGTQEEFGQGCDPIRFVWPTMMECVRAMQTGCVSSPGCCSYGSPPPPRCPPTRDSRCFVCSLGNGTVAGRNSLQGERRLDGPHGRRERAWKVCPLSGSGCARPPNSALAQVPDFVEPPSSFCGLKTHRGHGLLVSLLKITPLAPPTGRLNQGVSLCMAWICMCGVVGLGHSRHALMWASLTLTLVDILPKPTASTRPWRVYYLQTRHGPPGVQLHLQASCEI